MAREIGDPCRLATHTWMESTASKLHSMRLPRWSLFISSFSSCFYSIGMQRFNAARWLKHTQRANTAFGIQWHLRHRGLRPVRPPWEEQQTRAFNRRAVCLFIASSFVNSIQRYQREIERCIKDGKMPTRGYPRLLKTIASVRGGTAAQRAAQRAQEGAPKAFFSEGQQAGRAQVERRG
jgi:hypothetical protein